MNTDTTTGDGATGKVTEPVAGSTPQEMQQQVPGSQEPAAQGEEWSNPFDFTSLPDDEPAGDSGEQPAENGEQPEVEAYELDLGERYDGNPEIRSLLTDCAKDAKLPAKGTGAFVQAVANRLNEMQQAREKTANEALKTHWGNNYDANMKAAGRYLQQVARDEGFSEEEMRLCMNPVVFRLALRAEQAFSEGRAAKQGAPVSNQQVLDSILNDPTNEMHKILMQPNHAKYRATADYANSLAGMKLF